MFKLPLHTNMNFKVGSKVFYPSHGAGWIRNKKEIEFNGTKKMYYEFEFINSTLTVSSPIDNINNLNIRDVFSQKEIKPEPLPFLLQLYQKALLKVPELFLPDQIFWCLRSDRNKDWNEAPAKQPVSLHFLKLLLSLKYSSPDFHFYPRCSFAESRLS